MQRPPLSRPRLRRARLPERLDAVRAEVARRLKDRADSEHEQALTRLIVVPGMLAYMLWVPHAPEDAALIRTASLAIFAIGILSALAIIAHIVWRPAVNPVRRVLSMLVDVGGVVGTMLVGGMAATLFFPLLLWIIIGHGFRYGRPYLLAATVTSLAGFALVLAVNPDWRALKFVGAGLLLALIMLPAYFAVLLAKLTDAIRRAEEANRAKSSFLAAVSHEFRTPLNAVIGMSDLLRTTPLSQDQGDMVAIVRSAATGLLGLVNNVLDVAKLEARRFTIDEAPFDLHEVLATVRHLLFHAATSKGLYFRLRIGPDMPYRLSGDARALHQVLLNLAGNAVKFTEHGGVVIEVAPVVPAEGAARLRFEVRDTGFGLSPAAQAEVFESFAQAAETRKRVVGGTGLGLSIARELVELMGGRIGLASAQGVGSRFWIELPLVPAVAGEGCEEPPRGQVVVLGDRDSAMAAVGRLDRLGFRGRAVATPEAALQLVQGHGPVRVLLVTAHEPPVDIARLAAALPRVAGTEPCDLVTLGLGQGPLPDLTLADLPADAEESALLTCLRAALQAPVGARPREEGLIEAKRPLRRLHILVAEDNRTNQTVIQRLLAHAGHEVRVCGDGQAAIDALEQDRFDVVLMDINMPEMDGIETVKLLRFMHQPASLPPIVALSADVTPETQAACREVGFSGYLTKPIDTHILLRTLDQLTADGAATPEEAPSAPEPVADLADRGAGPVLDQAKLANLAKLDTGDGFLAQVIDEFLADAAEIVERIAKAARDGDARGFRDEAHALRSSAGYVGAAALFALCLSWRNLDDDALILRGRLETAQLRQEFERLKTALTAARTKGPTAVAGSEG